MAPEESRPETMSGNGLLQNKNAIVYGGGGRIGSGIARAFAREGARLYLAGRRKSSLAVVAADIEAAGGFAEVAEVDATDERAVDDHADAVAADSGSLDVSINVISYGDAPGTPLVELSADELTDPLLTGVRANFLTARAAARHMTRQGSGVILTVTHGSATAITATMGRPGVRSAAVESFTRFLASEVGPSGVRVLGLRIAAVPETWYPGRHTREDFERILGEEFAAPDPDSRTREMDAIVERLAKMSMLHRVTTLAEVSDVAAFLASSRAGAMTGTIANVTCGMVPD